MHAEGACHKIEILKEIWAGKRYLSIRQILHLDIPAMDKLWVASIPGVVPEEVKEKIISNYENAVQKRRSSKHTKFCWIIFDLSESIDIDFDARFESCICELKEYFS